MSSLSTFTNLMEQFLEELTQTFPENKTIKVYKSNFELLKSTNPRKVLDVFMSEVGPYSTYITNKDESFFDLDIDLNKKLGIKQIWTPVLSNTTKDAIWAHLNTLFVFGSTISMIPDNMMSSIEAMAQQCASSFENSDQDPAMLMKGMQNMLMNMPKQ